MSNISSRMPAIDSFADTSTSSRSGDPVGYLTCYLILLMGIPSALIFGPLGAAGTPANMLALGLMTWYLVMRLHPGFQLDTGHQPVRVAGLLFICTILCSYVSANLHTLSTLQQNGAERGILSTVGWVAILLLAADCINRADRLMSLISRIVIGGSAMAILGIIQFFTGLDATKYMQIPGLTFNYVATDLLSREGLNRPSATAAHPLEFAAVLLICLPLAIHQARFAPPILRKRRWSQVALIGVAIPMTVSRTAILGLVVCGIVLLPTWSRRHRRYAFAALLASIVAMFLVVPSLLSTFQTLIDQITAGSTSTLSRTNAISASAPFIAQHPWLGLGFGTFFPQDYFFTDDQYLNSLITNGALGLFSLIVLFITGWLMARSIRRSCTEPEIRDLAQSLAAAVAVDATCFATFDALSFSIAAGLTFLLLGCIGAAWRLYRPSISSGVH
jgi:polysaccharide biosynthesis protein PslJ